MIDAVTAIRTDLQLNAMITALTVVDTDKGIYRSPPGLPAGLGKNQQAPRCVVLQGVGGTNNSWWPDKQPRIYVRCYGPSGPAAKELYRRLEDHFSGPGGEPRMINNRWFLRNAVLSEATEDMEATGWAVAYGELNCQFDPTIGG